MALKPNHNHVDGGGMSLTSVHGVPPPTEANSNSKPLNFLMGLEDPILLLPFRKINLENILPRTNVAPKNGPKPKRKLIIFQSHRKFSGAFTGCKRFRFRVDLVTVLGFTGLMWLMLLRTSSFFWKIYM